MRLRWDPSISAGALIQAGVVAVGFVGFFLHLQGTIERHDAMLISHTLTLENLSATQNKLAENLKVLTTIVDERTRPRTYNQP